MKPGCTYADLAGLDRRFGIEAGAEISMKADPGTFDAERLRET